MSAEYKSQDLLDIATKAEQDLNSSKAATGVQDKGNESSTLLLPLHSE